ncbi:hypothetical protein PACTADRAFT_82692 [Pachysolen tannophilus NRRL Y-2460]|uniref:Cwf19-like C-terminal domain-containing protein n=1 Tax=Pachysolen tannophilus NRRL Y-2460 TaxID=669874 RepID=A0A1E4TNL9_PACTA|nr:hypothetical protein PACTADRAFT_82692 [Pachysolen tannophilus NRRL Y-2460]
MVDERKPTKLRFKSSDGDRKFEKSKRHSSSSKLSSSSSHKRKNEQNRSRGDGHHHHNRLKEDQDLQKSKKIKSELNESESEEDDMDDYEFIEAGSTAIQLKGKNDILENNKNVTRDEWMISTGKQENFSFNKASTYDSNDKKENRFVIEKNLNDKGLKESVPSSKQSSVTVTKSKTKSQSRLFDVPYEFGDSGSSWRMMKLRRIYDQAKEAKKPVEIIALERYGNLLEFDIAREEEQELNDRLINPGKTYKLKPDGSFYNKREFVGDNTQSIANEDEQDAEQKEEEKAVVVVTQSDLNKAKSELIRAKLRKSLDLKELEKKFKILENTFKSQQKDTIIDKDENSGNSLRKRKIINNLHDNNDDNETSIEQMAAEERMTDNNSSIIMNEIKAIFKNKKFSADLDEQDDDLSNTSSSLLKNLNKGKISLKETKLEQLKEISKKLDSCKLCLENDIHNQLPIISIGSHFILIISPQPDLVPFATTLIPLRHIKNTLYLKDEEFKELKLFMETLSIFYFQKLNKTVIFYELCTNKNDHCRVMAVPLPTTFNKKLVSNFFKNGIIEISNDFKNQHRAIIDTSSKPYQSLIAKESPYFHVWFDLSGGMGHIIEEENEEWPKDKELFVRRIIGGMLELDKFDIEKRRRLFNGESKEKVKKFQKLWDDFDFTKKLDEMKNEN